MFVFIVLAFFCLQSFFMSDSIAQTDKHLFVNELNYRKVRVGLYENKPKIFTNESGVASGIFPDILNEIARKEKWQLTYVPCEWNNCLYLLENGRIDLVPDVAFSPKRYEKFDFHTEPVIISWSTAYARDRNRMNTIADLNGQRIAVLNGSIQQTVLKEMTSGFGLKVSFMEAQSFEEAFSLTAKGDADAVVSNQFFGDYFYREYELEKTPIIFNPVSLYFATMPGYNADLLRAIDNNLQEMKSQAGSVYYEALQAWIKQTPKDPIPKYFILMLYGLSGILFLAVLFILLLRRQVRNSTGSLTRANELLIKSEKKFRDLFQKHTAVKLIINPDNGNIVEANEAAEMFYGWTMTELLRMRIQNINKLLPEKVEADMKEDENFESTQFECRHRLADGSVRDVVVFSNRVPIQGRPFLHFIIQDITDRRKEETARQIVEQALRDNEIKYRMLFETAGNAIMLMCNGRFTDCNTTTLTMFGCDRDQFIGSAPHEFSPSTQPDGQPSEKKALDMIHIALTEGHQRFEWTHCLRDGTAFPAEVSLNRLELGRETFLQAIVHDISERKQAEDEREKLHAQLIQAQKMEMVGRLAGGVAHDYNNVLSVILGYTELALSRVTPSDPIHGNLIEVLNAAKRSVDITRQLLAFARRQPVKPKTIDLNEMIKGILKMLQQLIGEDIDLTWRPGTALWPIYIDPSQLDQILTNLCTNARDAITGVGKIIIETDKVTLNETYCAYHDGFIPGDFILLTVSDDGCGMDRETLKKISNHFSQQRCWGRVRD